MTQVAFTIALIIAAYIIGHAVGRRQILDIAKEFEKLTEGDDTK